MEQLTKIWELTQQGLLQELEIPWVNYVQSTTSILTILFMIYNFSLYIIDLILDTKVLIDVSEDDKWFNLIAGGILLNIIIGVVGIFFITPIIYGIVYIWPLLLVLGVFVSTLLLIKYFSNIINYFKDLNPLNKLIWQYIVGITGGGLCWYVGYKVSTIMSSPKAPLLLDLIIGLLIGVLIVLVLSALYGIMTNIINSFQKAKAKSQSKKITYKTSNKNYEVEEYKNSLIN